MAATIEARKLHILEYLAEVQDEAVIHQIENLLFPKRDWWLDLSEREQHTILNGAKQAKEGKKVEFKALLQRLKMREA
ncbi:MAG: hypothetical protein ABIO24_09330 [Saprospiraceae bacterium]